jgi:TRAP-type C4-dicarboxylate transport system substrate-binding protein
MKGEMRVKKASFIVAILVIMTMLFSLVISCSTPSESSKPTGPAKPTEPEKPKEEVLLRLVTPQPPQDIIPINCVEMAARFNERAGGEYTIKVYTGEQLIKTPELLDSVTTGAVEMGAIGLGVYSGADPRFYGSEIPFLYTNLKADAAAQEKMPALWNTILEEKFNQTALVGWSITGTELISKVPIKKLEDWDGILLGSLSPGISGLTEALGGSAVVVPWTDIYSALEKGVVDASFQATP